MFKLKRYSQFQKVYKRGRFFKGNNITLSLLTNGLGCNRIGFSVSSKKVPLSVGRNRCKRLLSESYRLTEFLLKRGYDMVLMTNRDMSGHGLHGVKDEVIRLYRESGLLK